MTTPEIVTTCASIGALVTLIGNTILLVYNGMKGNVREKKIDEVHGLVNDLSDKRDAATQKSAFAEGVLSETSKGPQQVEIMNDPEHPVPNLPVKPSRT